MVSRRLRLLYCIKALPAWSRSSFGFWIRLWCSLAATMVRLLRSWMVFRCARPKKALRLLSSISRHQFLLFSFLSCTAYTGRTVIRKGWGIFRQKTRSCFLISHFILTERARKVFYRLLLLAWRFLGLSSSRSPFPLLRLFPFLSHQNCSLYFSRREGKTKRKKGDHKTSFGALGGFPANSRNGLQHFSISSLLLLPFWGPRLYYLDRGDLFGGFLLGWFG